MTETIVHAAVQTLLQALDDFSDNDVSLCDYRILDANASPPYAVIEPGNFDSTAGATSLGQKVPFSWQVIIDLFVLPKEDNAEWADMLTLTWNVVYKLIQYFNLDSLSGIITTHVRADEPGYVHTKQAKTGTVGRGTRFLARTITLTVIEKVDVSGGEYPS